MDKATAIFIKLAKKEESSTVLPVVAAAGGTGLLYTSLKRDIGKPYGYKSGDSPKLRSKLKQGDVVISGPYAHDVPGQRLFQTMHNRNDAKYHASVYIDGKLKEVSPISTSTKPRDLLDEDQFTVLRPKLDRLQKREYLKKLENIESKSYGHTAVAKAVLADKLHLKNVKCKGNFCSNIIAKALPNTFFDREISSVLPKHFIKNPNFKEVTNMSKVTPHLPFSNKALLKYVVAPAAIAGLGAYAYDKLKEKNSER